MSAVAPATGGTVAFLAAAASGTVAFLVAGLLLGRRLHLARWSRRGQGSARTRLWLAQAGVRATPARLWAGSALLGLAVALATTTLTAAPAVAVAPAVAAALAPRLALERRRSRRLREVTEAWPDGLRDLGAAARAPVRAHSSSYARTTPPRAQRPPFSHTLDTLYYVWNCLWEPQHVPLGPYAGGAGGWVIAKQEATICSIMVFDA